MTVTRGRSGIASYRLLHGGVRRQDGLNGLFHIRGSGLVQVLLRKAEGQNRQVPSGLRGAVEIDIVHIAGGQRELDLIVFGFDFGNVHLLAGIEATNVGRLQHLAHESGRLYPALFHLGVRNDEGAHGKGIDANLLNGKDGPRRVGVGGDLIPGLERRKERVAAWRRCERNRETR